MTGQALLMQQCGCDIYTTRMLVTSTNSTLKNVGSCLTLWEVRGSSRYKEYEWVCMKRIQRVTGCGGQCKRGWDSQTRKVMTAGIQTGVLNLTASTLRVHVCVSAWAHVCDWETERTLKIRNNCHLTHAINVTSCLKCHTAGVFCRAIV